MRTITTDQPSGNSGFQRIVNNFLAGAALPFANVLSAQRIQRAFADDLFGMDTAYSTVTVLWAFLAQVLHDGKEASCQAAVAGIVAWRLQQDLPAPTADTGDYCRARAKLSEVVLHRLTVETAEELQQQVPDDWLWKGRHAKLVDGFTFTMPDTVANQCEYPQHVAQKKGIGFPIVRCVAILSLATACLHDLAVGPYAGKETGETALLRELFESFNEGDVVVADRFYCSFMMIALLLGRGVDLCVRMHQRRHVDFRRGKRLGKHDHLIEWHRPECPEWMDEATYAMIPETLTLREIRFNITEPGRRTQSLTVVTTLVDADEYSKQDIADLYGFRWSSELDIRSIKQSLGLDHARCKSPAMVRKELWTTLLGYNLIRATAASAALLHDKQPRQISFTGTCQHVLSAWMLLSIGACTDVDLFCRAMLARIASCEVADRPGRIEPRVLKRRCHRYPLMKQPRGQLRQELQNANGLVL